MTSGVYKHKHKPHQGFQKGNQLWKKRDYSKMKGKHLSPQTEWKIGDSRISGKNSNNWKGGITPINKQIRHSPEFKQWGKSVFERDNYTCQKCGDKKGGNLAAHHILPFSLYPSIKFKIWNGITLCRECHNLTIKKEIKFGKQIGWIIEEIPW